MTLDGDHDAYDALPFRGRVEAPRHAVEDEPTRDPLGGTVVPGSDPRRPADLPFRPMIVPDLSLEQYASLCAEREHRPDDVDAIRRRWAVEGHAAERALDDRWQARLRADAAEAQRFYNLVASYRTWLASQG